MPWIIGGAALGGAVLGSNAAGGASKKQADATNQATEATQQQYQSARADQAPFRSSGSAALQRLMSMIGLSAAPASGANSGTINQLWSNISSLERQKAQGTDARGVADPAFDKAIGEAKAQLQQLGVDPSQAAPDQGLAPDQFGTLNKKFGINDFWADPVTQLGYQSGLDLGKTALYNAAPLTTGRDSGAAVKELTKFGTDYTGSKAGESQARFENTNSGIFNKLMAMIGGGQVATQATGNAGANAIGTTAGLLTSGANAQGAAGIAGANAWSGGLGNIANWWQQNATLDKLMKTGKTGVGNLQSWAQQNYGTPGYYALGEG